MDPSTVLVRDRSAFVIGVLKTTKEYSREQGVPWLSRVPILGYLFKSKELRNIDQELLFVIRPEIIKG